MALRDKEGFDLEALQKVWKEVGNLADSIAEGYCSIEDLHAVLESEAGARIVGGIALERVPGEAEEAEGEKWVENVRFI